MKAYFSIYGHTVECLILRDHGTGTFDVQRLSDGRCFRVSGIMGGKQ